MLSRIRSIASSLLMHTRTMGKSVIGITEAVAHLQLTFRDLFQSDGIFVLKFVNLHGRSMVRAYSASC